MMDDREAEFLAAQREEAWEQGNRERAEYERRCAAAEWEAAEQYQRLDTLAHNLAIGAALCRAWLHGFWTCHDSNYDLPDELIERWEPGCGRRARDGEEW